MTTEQLRSAGLSIWLDDLSRSKISGSDKHSLPHRIENDGVVGVTTNPSIFGAAIIGSDDYSVDIAGLKGESVERVVQKLTTDDVRSACQLFSEIYHATSGVDGRVSIEVDPRSAHDTAKTIDEAKALHALVNQPNVMIKVPATIEGLPAITELITQGISINVTLIFSLERYKSVLDAFLSGLEARVAQGLPISEIHSVASFFISRIDSAIDPILEKLGYTELQGRIAVANAHLAYEHFLQVKSSARWSALAALGGNLQRPLWASTGVKNPAIEDTRYVIELVASNCVNTMPQATLDALIDHGQYRGDSITPSIAQSHQQIDSLKSLGISLDDVTHALEVDGVKKFKEAWEALLADVEKVLHS